MAVAREPFKEKLYGLSRVTTAVSCCSSLVAQSPTSARSACLVWDNHPTEYCPMWDSACSVSRYMLYTAPLPAGPGRDRGPGADHVGAMQYSNTGRRCPLGPDVHSGLPPGPSAWAMAKQRRMRHWSICEPSGRTTCYTTADSDASGRPAVHRGAADTAKRKHCTVYDKLSKDRTPQRMGNVNM